jgi:hypothetical protein
MPHVVLNGKIVIENVFKNFKSIFFRDNDGVLKTKEQFISKDMKSILIDSLSIEGSNKYNFFTLINERPDGVVIRIHPGVTIKKTQGVKKILAEIAKQIMAFNPNLKVGKTNLKEYLES